MKPPPHGLEWRRLSDGAWELRTIKKTPLVGYEEGKGEEEEEEDEVAESGKALLRSRLWSTPIRLR